MLTADRYCTCSRPPQALAGLLRRDHPGGSLYETALDNGQEAVMRAVEEVEGGGHAGERGGV